MRHIRWLITVRRNERTSGICSLCAVRIGHGISISIDTGIRVGIQIHIGVRTRTDVCVRIGNRIRGHTRRSPPCCSLHRIVGVINVRVRVHCNLSIPRAISTASSRLMNDHIQSWDAMIALRTCFHFHLVLRSLLRVLTLVWVWHHFFFMCCA